MLIGWIHHDNDQPFLFYKSRNTDWLLQDITRVYNMDNIRDTIKNWPAVAISDRSILEKGKVEQQAG
jgi:hypothetical protein